MRSDQVFVLLLIILIPMTGCFDNSVGDAEGAQDTTESESESGTTVVNNYYNTTAAPQTDMYLATGTYGGCSSWTNTTTNSTTTSVCNNWTTPDPGTYEFISISENTTVKIHGLTSSVGMYNYINIQCESGFYSNNIVLGSSYTMMVIGTDGGNCSITNSVNSYMGDWSFVYEVIPVTLV